jgi:hypothetical protein
MVGDRSIKHLCPVDLDNLSLLTVVQQDDTPFAAVFTDADAYLIAAAPDMLAALRAALPYLHPDLPEYDQVAAAIAKAVADRS